MEIASRKKRVSWNKSRLATVQEEHSRIVEAIRDPDPEKARAAMRAHISNARNRALDDSTEPI